MPAGGGCLAQQADQPAGQPPTTAGSRLLDRLNQRAVGSSECKGDYCILIGQVELPLDSQTTLFADQVELFLDTNRVIAQGNVVFASAEGRLSAERLEYDAATGIGTFQTANGLMALGEYADRSQFGNQEADVYFYGDIIQKLGPRKYRITRGGFTTCVQPTPRWEVTSGSVTLNLNDSAIAREHRPAGQGRAGAVPAGDVLPDTRGSARHRVSPADLGHVLSPWTGDQQRVLLGHQPQHRCHLLSRLVYEHRPGRGRRVSLRRSRAVHGRHPVLSLQPEGSDVRERWRDPDTGGDREL